MLFRSLTGYNMYVSKNATGATSCYGIRSNSTVQSDVTSSYNSYYSSLNTAAASFTLSSAYHFYASGTSTFGSGSTVTNQIGLNVDSSLTGATNNYAASLNVASGSNRWNLYAGGTANNYFAGAVGIGSTSLTGYNFYISRNATGATSCYGARSDRKSTRLNSSH